MKRTNMREIKFRKWSKNTGGKYRMKPIEDLNEINDPELKIMQFTGLLDKNGKEIYEGDIVKYETNYYGNHKVSQKVIEWMDDLGHDGFGEPLALGYLFPGYNFEVIGNIYTNPDLLK